MAHWPNPPGDARDESIRLWVEDALPRALAYALSLLADRHAAEDVVHDCFCRLLARRGTYDLPRDGFKLLLRSITNACIDRRRKSAALTNTIDAEEAAVPVDRRFAEPPEAAMQRELERAIGAALEELPLKQRAALELKSFGCTLAEIAQALAVGESHAGVLVHRARRAVARSLEPLLDKTHDR